jgi:poly(3-hydroxybutyrate) depolymerase
MFWLMAAMVLVLSLASLWATKAHAARAPGGAGGGAPAAPAAPRPPGALPLVVNTVNVNGQNRTYAYYVSAKANTYGEGYVVYALHDNGQTAEQFADQSGWAKLADEYGFVVIFPQAANNTWPAVSGAADDYLQAVMNHARGNILSRVPGDVAVARGGAAGAEGAPPAQRRIGLLPTHMTLTGAGAGGVVAQEFAIDHPGRIAALATLDGTPFPGAYGKGGAAAEDLFHYGRGKLYPPTVKLLKKDVPVPTWLFSTAQTPAQTRLATYWKQSNGVAPAAANRSIGGLQTAVFRNTQNPAQQVRTTALPAGTKYDEAMASAIWNDLFSKTARWTSAPNGDLATILNPVEFEKAFQLRTADIGGAPFKYYVKLPSSYQKGKALPVVVALHGGGQTPWLFSGQVAMHDLGEKEGFITVYPTPQNQAAGWTAADFNGPDAKGVEAAVNDVLQTYGADKSRVYLFGFSVGSRMAQSTVLTRPRMFAAFAPSSGFPPLSPEVQARIAELKKEADYRMPTYGFYGASDTDASTDGKIPAKGQLQGGIDAFKAYNHITTADRAVPFDAQYSAPYDVLVTGGRQVWAGVDKRYPTGRIQIWQYASADPKPLNLLNFGFVVDMAHSNHPQQAQLAWDYFKHWTRNPDGTVTYRP